MSEEGPVKKFWKELENAIAAVESGGEPQSEMEHAAAASMLMPHGVTEADYASARGYKLPDAPTDMFKGGKLKFSFKVPSSEYRLTKATYDRIERLVRDTREAIEKSKLKRDLEGKGIKIRGWSGDALFGACLKLQKRLDSGEDVEAILHRTQLATAVARDGQLAHGLESSDYNEATNALVQLHRDRFEDVKREVISDEGRIKALRVHYSKILGLPLKELPANKEVADKSLQGGTLVSALKGKKPRKDAKRFLLSFDPEYDKFNVAHAPFRKGAKKLVEGLISSKGSNLMVDVDFTPNRRHFFTGAISGDCARYHEKELMKRGWTVGSIFERSENEPSDKRRLVGSVYLLRGNGYLPGDSKGKRVLHIDALQPYNSKADQTALAKGFVQKLGDMMHEDFRAVTANRTSVLFSNHATMQHGYNRAFPKRPRCKVSFDHPSSTQSIGNDHTVLHVRK